jgi:hypothetical protein
MMRLPDAVAAIGAVVLLVWLLAVAGAFSLPGAADWALFGTGVGVLAAARVLRGRGDRPAQRPL